MADRITATEFHAAEGVGDWRVLGDGACTFYRTDTFVAAAGLLAAIAAIPGIADHPPDIDVRPDGVTVRLLTKDADYWGMSARDVDVARAISAAAAELGLSGDPAQVQSLLVVPGGPDAAAIMPFWQVLLGYERRSDSPDEDLVDPHARWPGFWFEQMKETRADGSGAIHVAVWVPPEQAQARLDGALAAGGRIVRDRFAPAWWTLADAAGNEADIATVENRD